MDVLSKLRSTVSNTVSQLSGVLPGNPVTREFEVTNLVCSAGPGLLWRVYNGYKKSTRQEASIFVFEKKALERWPRESRDAILESLKRGVTQLTKLRHPQVLIVQHPLEESRESLAFAVEPVLASLANLLDSKANEELPGFKTFELFEVEIKYGLMQIAEGLAFLHNDVKLVHHNICPEAIMVNQQGAWKIACFDFCVHSELDRDGQPSWWCSEWTRSSPHVCQPSLDYLAVEHLSGALSPASDMFSLGVLVHALHSHGKPVFQCQDDIATYKRKTAELKNLNASKLQHIPEGLREYVKLMLNSTPQLRPDAHQFTKMEYFEDVGVKTLNYLDSLFQWDKVQKSQFYKGLPPIIEKLPHRVCLHRVVPCLSKEYVNPSMVPFVLPSVLHIAESSTPAEFTSHILPSLQTVMKLTEPVQILLIFMQKMELLLRLTPAQEVKTSVLPMLYHALDSNSEQIQQLCLSVLHTFCTLIDSASMKNAVLPRLKKLTLTTDNMAVRVSCLLCLGRLLEHLDKWVVLDEVLSFLPQIPGRQPAVLMAILGIYKVTLTHKKLGIPKELLASQIIPFLMPLTVESGLTLNQFNTLIAMLKDMSQRVETEQRGKLEQLQAMQSQQNSLNASLNLTLNSSTGADSSMSSNKKTELDDIFNSVELPGVNSVSNHSTNTRNSASGGLSIEDKQRLVKQQETQQRLKQQPSLHPTATNSNQVKQPPPQNLTDTLLQNNLSQLNLSQPSMNRGWTGQTQQFSAFQTAPVMNTWQNTTGFTTPVGNQTGPSLGFPRFPSQQPPLLPYNTFTPPQQVKPLSSSDINDLLS